MSLWGFDKQGPGVGGGRDIQTFKFLLISPRLHAIETVVINIRKKCIGRMSGNAWEQGGRSLKIGWK